MEHKTYKTQAVCSKQIDFDYDEQKRMYNLKFIGGCNGNLKAIGKLCEGKQMEEIMNILSGNTCGARPTSCADQLSRAIKEVIENA